jgi:hypothetical protein
MSAPSANLAQPQPFADVLQRLRIGSPYLFRTAVLMLALALVCTVLQGADDRLIHGVSVWSKPSKFFLSLTVQFLTVSWAMGLLPEKERQTRGMRIAVHAMAIAGWIEMAYMVFRASRAEASHFNVSTPFAAIMYPLMGLGALTLTVTAAYVGWRVWRQRDGDLWREAAGFGLILGAVLGTIAGAYMSSQTGHWVGGAATDAGGLGFFHWSTTGGDLRVAHFIGLHAAQIVPLAALSGRRSAVYGAGILISALTMLTFAQAIAGMPLLKS